MRSERAEDPKQVVDPAAPLRPHYFFLQCIEQVGPSGFLNVLLQKHRYTIYKMRWGVQAWPSKIAYAARLVPLP